MHDGNADGGKSFEHFSSVSTNGSPSQTGHNGGGRHTPAGAVHREAHQAQQRELQSNTYTCIYSYTIHRFAASTNGNAWQHNRNYTPGRSPQMLMPQMPQEHPLIVSPSFGGQPSTHSRTQQQARLHHQRQEWHCNVQEFPRRETCSAQRVQMPRRIEDFIA